MNSVGHPHTLQIGGELCERFSVAVTFIIFIHGFQCAAYTQIMFVVLIVQDIASFDGRL